ncbi:aldo/keto reductase [Mucilaginibacter sp. AW1-3]
MQAINKIVLGTVQFGLNYGINNTTGKPTQQTVNAILNAAHQSGVRCLDTAEAYGNAHDIIGQFHRQYPHQVFNVITKLPHHIDEKIEDKIEKYLDELHVKQLEGLLFHSYQTYKDNQQSVGRLNTYKNNGKVKHLGVSVYTNQQMEDVIADDNISIIQLPFNLFDNINQRGQAIKKAKARGKIIHTRSAFLQGLFFSSLQNPNETVKALINELTYIQQLSARTEISIQKMALNYCLQQPDIDHILIGVDTLEQLNQNLANADESLTAGIINSINDIRIKNSDLLNPSLWKQ